MKPRKLTDILLWTTLLLAACQGSSVPTSGPTTEALATTAPLQQTVIPTATAPSTPTPNPNPTQQVNDLPQDAPRICSPLAGLSLADLKAGIANPYDPPAAGLDGPHQGIDLADLEPNNRYAREGLAVQAVLAGKVAAVIDDRFPYGNALLIETSLTDLPPAILEGIDLPAVQPPQLPHPALSCPELPLPDWDFRTRSLYLLYAHLQHAPQLAVEDKVACEQPIGAIGSSGNALNPHLHLEIRVGPAGARFASLAHYDSSASLEEMANYCAWRVRGIFQLVNPLLLLQYLPEAAQPSLLY